MRNRIDIEAVMKRHDDEYDYIQRMHEADIEQKSKDKKIRSTLDLEEKIRELKKYSDPEPFVLECLRKRVIEDIVCEAYEISGVGILGEKVRRVLNGFDIGTIDPEFIEPLFSLRSAAEYVFDIAKTEEPLTEELVKEIHRITMGKECSFGGRYREKRQKVPGCPKEPAFPEDIGRRLNDLLSSIRTGYENIPIWMRIAHFHIEFEDIHPFDDGNGRVGILLADLELMREGYPPIVIYYSDCVEYFRSFDLYYREGNEVPMINFFINVIERAVDRYLDVYCRYDENIKASKRLNRRKYRKIASR